MTMWVRRLQDEMRLQGLSAAELARRIGVPDDRVRAWINKGVKQPRGDALQQLSDALALNPMWLQHGMGERYAAAAARAADPANAEISARIEFGGRVRAARLERGFGTFAAAARGLAMTARRWEEVEDGRSSPGLVELEMISERVRRSLDWLVMGQVAPVDRPFPIRDPKGQTTFHEGD